MNIFQKDRIRILVTDSGIGGLSVVNDLYDFFQHNRYYKSVEICFADSRIENIGYNEIENINDKIKLFSDRLYYLDKKIKPDILFVACNTLSVIIKQTDFYYKCKYPIVDMLNSSINLLIKELMKNRAVFILGTKTTISENYYKKYLIDCGFDRNMIINQLCPNLARYIEETHYSSWNMNYNVNWLVNRIISKKTEYCKKYTISLNCTHYYYAMKCFNETFRLYKEKPNIICPNTEIKNVFTDQLNIVNYNFCNVCVKIYKKNICKSIKNKINFFLPNIKKKYFYNF